MVTGNPHKAREVAAFFGGTLEIEHVSLDCPEFRHDDVREIAKGKASFAYLQLGRPLIVDDTALFIRALRGFPGPYAAYVLGTIGNPGILRLMEGSADRFARFETAIAYAWDGGIEVFLGVLEGTITQAPSGESGFGYDPIFAYNERTLAELDVLEKSRMSHRARALHAFRTWFLTHGGNGTTVK